MTPSGQQGPSCDSLKMRTATASGEREEGKVDCLGELSCEMNQDGSATRLSNQVSLERRSQYSHDFETTNTRLWIGIGSGNSQDHDPRMEGPGFFPEGALM